MRAIDLNADIGEADTPTWLAVEAAVMPHITSANIACGGHAGDRESMARTVKLAVKHGVNIGAHPAYPDKENFGRRSMVVGVDVSARALRQSLSEQIISLAEIAANHGQALTYVKPHGALYNDSVFDPNLALLLADVVAGIDPKLWLMGAPGSAQEKAAKSKGLTYISEGFIDRRYTDDGHLQSRKEDGAVIKDQSARQNQAVALLNQLPVTTASGGKLSLSVDTLCLHSDSPGADETAALIRKALTAQNAVIKAFTHA